MEKKKNTLVLRILTAVCFLWLPVNAITAFVSEKVYESENVLTIVVAALPFVAGLFMVIGALVGSRVMIGLGSFIYVLQAGYRIFSYIMMLSEYVQKDARKALIGVILYSVLLLLAFLFLALACFVKKSDLALCLLTIVLFVAWFFVFRGQIPAGASKWPLQLVIAGAGSVLGTIFLALFFAINKKKE